MPNSKRKCKYCLEYVRDFVLVPAGPFCSFDHAILFANKKRESASARFINNAKKRASIELPEVAKTKRQLDRESLKWQKSQTQKAFNKMRVQQELLWFYERELVPTCISCGKELGGDVWACGHFKTVGSHPEIRFDRKNAYLQHNNRCNMRLSGDINGTKTTMGYLAGLRHRFGDDVGQKIIDYCESYHPPKNYTCAELESIRKTFNAEFRRISKILSK